MPTLEGKVALVTGGAQRFTMAWREDTDLFFRMLNCSFKLHYAPAAVVLHPVRPAPWGISIKQQRKSMYNALLYKKHPGLYRRHIQSRPPLKYYTIVLSAIIALGAASSGSWMVASLIAILWALQTLYFALQRLRHTSRRLDHVLEMLVTSIFIPRSRSSGVFMAQPVLRFSSFECNLTGLSPILILDF